MTSKPPREGEDWADVALRLRAVLAHSAGLELAVVSGWNEAASASSRRENQEGPI